MALVVKRWYADTKPNDNGHYVEIAAREPGFFAWLLSLFKIDPSFFLNVGYDQVTFEKSNFTGYKKIVVTTENISSSFYGYHKPWIKAVTIFLIFLGIGSAFAQSSPGAAFAIFVTGLLIAVVYYFLNKELIIGFSETNGDDYSLVLKRSVIEGQEINEKQMELATEILLTLIRENKVSSKIK